MKKCSKCGIEKELDQYEKYWHSTQNTHRIRGYCKPCFRQQQKQVKQRLKEQKIIQPVEDLTPPVPIVDYTGNKDYRLCPDCKEWKYRDQYYVNRHNKKGEERIWGRCKPCQKIYDKNKAHQEMLEKGGPERIYQTPNKYSNDYQRDRTFEIMKAIGWNFNEEKGIWWKDGIKTSDGLFINIPDSREHRKLNKKLGKYDNVVRHEARKHSDEIYQLRQEGYTLDVIAIKFNTSSPTIRKIIDLYEKSLNR